MSDHAQGAAAELIAVVVQEVAELPDRTSPEDWPEAMLITADELTTILHGFAARVASSVAAENLERAEKAESQRDELLAALKVAEEYVHLWMQEDTSEDELKALEQIEAAIAKAEGK